MESIFIFDPVYTILDTPRRILFHTEIKVAPTNKGVAKNTSIILA